MRYAPLALAAIGIVVFPFTAPWFGSVFAWLATAACVALVALGVWDLTQPRHSLKRNYPILANLRFILEKIRPEIRQYFLESDTDGTPFNRNKRAIVYQRAKMDPDKRPFGTQQDVYAENFEWLTHSIAPAAVPSHDFRVMVGGPACTKPYSLSLFNISAMSFGSLSANAIRALNKGAALGRFAHDTGEGGFSPYHKEFGGDIIWEIGSGYFGCRDANGRFSPERFKETVSSDQIKMVEIKLSQGAKPGHGGVLPAAKVTPEIAATRGVPVGVDCISPAAHSAFSTPVEMMHFIQTLRELSGGKPVGFKLCIGNAWEFAALCKAMLETGIAPDFIVIDGAEGGTGAAPLEFTDHVGTPLREGLIIARNMLVGAGLKPHIRIGASGKIVTAFDMARVMALGADWCNSARGFMFSIGCIQAMACHTDHCPSGVATQDPLRQRALVVPDKAERVRRFHDATLMALAEMIAAAGLTHPGQIEPSRIMRRLSPLEVRSFAQVYPFLEPGELIDGTAHPDYARHWAMADAHSFQPKAPAAQAAKQAAIEAAA
jgi:glutamate synthase domain-containing protein 2